ncbi:MAG: DNA repair protein RadC [Deltaproteobacteria bacterium]|nr:MAG: DNA repair protein RadC [Deltaproteobacteria bacterium]
MTIAIDTLEVISNQVLEPLAVAQLLANLADRPRERLWQYGAQALGDAELIALVLGTGARDRPVRELAADLVRSVGGIASLSRASPRELAQHSGIGPARAAQLVAAFELGRRAIEVVHRRRSLGSAADVYHCIAPRLAGVSQEVFFVIGVDVRNGLLDVVEVARGSIAHVEVHPREVFRPLVRMAAAGGVLVHNHPSGDATPSREDCGLTERMREAGRLLGIPIIDHVVIGDRSYRSIAEWMGTEF